MDEAKQLVFRAPDPNTAGYPKRLRAALRFQIMHSDLIGEMSKLTGQEQTLSAEIAALSTRENSGEAMADALKKQSDLREKQRQAAKAMLEFWDNLMDFLTSYVVADTRAEARELLEDCSENQLTELMKLMGGSNQTLPPKNTEPSKE